MGVALISAFRMHNVDDMEVRLLFYFILLSLLFSLKMCLWSHLSEKTKHGEDKSADGGVPSQFQAQFQVYPQSELMILLIFAC